MAGLVINFHAYIQDPMLLLLCAALLFAGEQFPALHTVLQTLLLPTI